MSKRGGSKGRAKPSLYSLTREHLTTTEEVEAFLQELSNADDRTCAIIGSAGLEQLLETILNASFIVLDEEETRQVFHDVNAPLSTFSSRIDLCWLTGKISAAMKRQLHQIRRIRNAFAHRVHPLTFDHPLILDACSQLECKQNDLTGRRRFTYVVLECHTVLMEAAHAEFETRRAAVEARWLLAERTLHQAIAQVFVFGIPHAQPLLEWLGSEISKADSPEHLKKVAAEFSSRLLSLSSKSL